jgi:hypothetical protein
MCVSNTQIGAYGGFQQELENLKRDKGVLMMELVRMRQAQTVRADMRAQWRRVERVVYCHACFITYLNTQLV